MLFNKDVSSKEPIIITVKQIKMAQMASGEGGAATGGGENNSMEISEDVLEKLRRHIWV